MKPRDILLAKVKKIREEMDNELGILEGKIFMCPTGTQVPFKIIHEGMTETIDEDGQENVYSYITYRYVDSHLEHEMERDRFLEAFKSGFYIKLNTKTNSELK